MTIPGLKKRNRPNQAELQDQRRRMNVQPAISEALAHPVVGSGMEYYGQTDPPGGKYLICDGRALKQTDYPDLFAVLGADWNTGGEAGDEFRIPDRRNRTGVGASPQHPMTERFGSETHTLSDAEMPSHSHGGGTGGGGSHSHTGKTDAYAHDHGGTFGAGNHSHDYNGQTNYVSGINLPGGGTDIVGFRNGNRVTTTDGHHAHEIPTNTHSHDVSTFVAPDHAHAIAASGGGQAHNNVQPSLAVNYIIRAVL